jgi:NH3-dependent NAD+ synthetase
MNRITDYQKLAGRIVTWLGDYVVANNIKAFVIGVSGGIDSAVLLPLQLQLVFQLMLWVCQFTKIRVKKVYPILT